MLKAGLRGGKLSRIVTAIAVGALSLMSGTPGESWGNPKGGARRRQAATGAELLASS